ncbi:alpha/beta hydrolase [Aliidongia dinghuensis]|uniref:Alpha/beta hydrolase n=1 Tax=Aliidongia dinghuensis TaxID=1867774 RepID=A0A8J2YRV3_9PROT|nr:alpha/beta fold hydrolase [Aliidongia dinghuensis]GGF11117.1 alpha/beta hydrolase [Aliidongia dinghuensis]
MRRGVAIAGLAGLGVALGLAGVLLVGAFHRPAPPRAEAAAPRAHGAPRVETVDCWFKVPAGRVARCGRLKAPENWGAPDGREVVVPFVVFSGGAGAAPDPVIYINGGPGEPSGIGASEIGRWWGILSSASWAQGRDVVVFDERGVGLSEPTLTCPEMIEIGERLFSDPMPPAAVNAAWAEAAGRCHARLVAAGIKLERYNTNAIVHDLTALIDGLGYRSWNLLAVSYGTRVALSFLRDHGVGTRSVILDSVYPPSVKAYEDAAGSAAHAMAGLVAYCAGDPACRAANPHFAAALQAQIHRAAKEALVVPLHRPGQPDRRVSLDDAKLVEVLFYGFYRSEDLRKLPGAITALDQGNAGPLAPFVEAALDNYRSPDTSHGLYLSVTCHDEFPFDDPQVVERAASASGDLRQFALSDLALAACPAWPAGIAAKAERQPVESDVPIVLLSGDLDPVTPAAWAKTALATLPHGSLFHFPGVGHGVLAANACADRIVRRFLAKPETRPFDDCLLTLTSQP